MEVIGIEKVDYISKKSNQRVEGLNLHCMSDPVETDSMSGRQVDRIFVSVRSGAWPSVQGLCLGASIKVLYNRYGSVDDVIVQVPVKAAAGK